MTLSSPLHDRLWQLGATRLPSAPVSVDVHPIGHMDPADPDRWRLSAEAERRAARSWLLAAVAASTTVEVLACTELGRTALRQAAAYDELAASAA